MPIPFMSVLVVMAAQAVVAAGSSAAPASGTTLSMMEHQSVTVAPGAVLTYDSVNDSRCPPDVQCVVAGKVVYSFTLTLGATREQFTLSPAAPVFTPAALQGKQVALADAIPPRLATAVNIRIITP
ncbi:MAG: hypothetical protein M3Y65_10375 [Pseudomonadota bacterium]|nr:hypothetical protein [Pseudomonadota bacterium]